MKKMLILGPRQNKHDPTKTGGVTVLFELLLEELTQRNVPYEVIDTLVANNGGRFMALMRSYCRLLWCLRAANHISLQATHNVFVYVAPIAIILGKAFGRKVSIRIFAGSMNQKYEKNVFFRWISHFVLHHADVVFFETKYLVEHFKPYNPHTYWFPNVRKVRGEQQQNKSYTKRFIYIGTINEEKGIDLLCDVSGRLPEGTVLDIYGPIIEEKYSDEYFAHRGVSYKGALRPDEVLDVMGEYDVLILPSYREGYPGVIIEAFMMGLPVIATRLDGIMEMVKDGYNGILIDPGDQDALLEAMQSLDTEIYEKLHQNSRLSFHPYNSTERTEFFLEKIGYDAR